VFSIETHTHTHTHTHTYIYIYIYIYNIKREPLNCISTVLYKYEGSRELIKLCFADIIPFYIHGFYEHSPNCKKRHLALLHLHFGPSAWKNSAPTGKIFIKFDTRLFFKPLSRKFKFYDDLTRIRSN